MVRAAREDSVNGFSLHGSELSECVQGIDDCDVFVDKIDTEYFS